MPQFCPLYPLKLDTSLSGMLETSNTLPAGGCEDKEEKRMARTLIMGLILLLGLPLPLFAGEITGVKVEKKTQDEIEIIIEGDHGAYQGYP